MSVITVKQKVLPMFGEWIKVSKAKNMKFVERIFIAEDCGVFHCVNQDDEDSFKNGLAYGVVLWNYAELPEVEILWEPKHGEEIMVSNYLDETPPWAKRTFLYRKEDKYVCLLNNSEKAYESGDSVYISQWLFAKPVPKVIELTMEQIAEKFGIPANEIKII